jgi:hypothetical protein
MTQTRETHEGSKTSGTPTSSGKPFTAPPAGFDPRTADAHELLVYGFPGRPDAAAQPELAARWEREVGKQRTRIEPTFTRTEKRHEPRRLPAAQAGAGAHSAVADATSTNWSGSVAFANRGDACSFVAGQWTVADPNTPAGHTGAFYSSSWVGIDGDGSGDVLQAGTASDIVNGNKEVYAWWEWYPNYEMKINNFPVSAGDTMYCLICALSNTTAAVYLANNSTNHYTSFSITAPKGTTLVGNCAEWIVEAPTVGGQQATPPDYGVVYFDEGIAGTKKGALLNAFNALPIDMVSGSNTLSIATLEKYELIKCTYNG